MANVIEIFKGDSTNVVTVTFKGETDYSTYTGLVEVLTAPDTVPLISRSITPDTLLGLSFFLTAEETDLLAYGTYLYVYTIENIIATEVVLHKEVQNTLIIKQLEISNRISVADIIEYAKYGELAQLGVIKLLSSADPATVINAEKQVISYINLGLIELYKRFNIRTEEVVLTLSAGTTLYTISQANVGIYLSELVGPYNSIIAAYDEDGKEYSLNDADDYLSILTPGFNTVQVPNPVEGEAVFLIYNASPDKLSWSYDLNLIEVPIAPMLLEALLNYIGYRGHGSMDGSIQAENNTHLQRFEASCARLRTLGAIPEEGRTSGTSLEQKGFV